MATIIIHAGHFKPGNIRSWWARLAEDPLVAFPGVMRLTDAATGSVICYKLEDLTELEVASEESTKKMMGAIGWGLVGDLALGPLGLLAGVLSGGKQTNVKFIGKFRDGRRMLATTDSKTFTAMQAALFNKALAPISPPEPAPSANRRQVDAAQSERQKLIAAGQSKPSSFKGNLTDKQFYGMVGVGLLFVLNLIIGSRLP
jgi:hypothetical protein